jgi:hypothetical protein
MQHFHRTTDDQSNAPLYALIDDDQSLKELLHKKFRPCKTGQINLVGATIVSYRDFHCTDTQADISTMIFRTS